MRLRKIASPFGADYLQKFDPSQARDDHGRWASDGGGDSPTRADVFAAGLRGFKGSRTRVKAERHKNPRIAKLRSDIGYEHGEFGIGVEGKGMEHVTIRERNEAQGAWVEKGPDGKPMYVSEPSFHVQVEGPEREIFRRASALGQKYNQQAVAVAVHDSGVTDTGVFRVAFQGGMSDRDMEAVTQHFIDKGLGGATSFLDKNELRLLATKKSEMNLIARAAKSVPREYRPKLTFVPARVKFIADSEYTKFTKAEQGSPKVVADVFVMGVGPARN